MWIRTTLTQLGDNDLFYFFLVPNKKHYVLIWQIIVI